MSVNKPPTPEHLEAAINALKAGDKVCNQKLLAPILQADPRNERDWVRNDDQI